MANLTYKDWGRIYGFLALELKNKKSPEYEEYVKLKELLEKNPVQGITKIIAALNKDYPDKKIEYKPYSDTLADGIKISGPPELLGTKAGQNKLQLIRGGIEKAKIVMRLAC